MRRILFVVGVSLALALGPALVDSSILASAESRVEESGIPLEWLGRGDVGEDGVSVTWYGDHHTGAVYVLWASSADVQVMSEDGEIIIPEFIGRLNDADLERMADRLEALSLIVPRQLIPRADAHVPPGTICHTHLNEPLWTGGLGVDAIGASSKQHCLAGTTNWLEGKLQRKTWWIFYSTRDSATDGWQASETFVAMVVDCNTMTSTDWRNLTNGKVIYQGQTYSVTLTSGWDPLGCRD